MKSLRGTEWSKREEKQEQSLGEFLRARQSGQEVPKRDQEQSKNYNKGFKETGMVNNVKCSGSHVRTVTSGS